MKALLVLFVTSVPAKTFHKTYTRLIFTPSFFQQNRNILYTCTREIIILATISMLKLFHIGIFSKKKFLHFYIGTFISASNYFF